MFFIYHLLYFYFLIHLQKKIYIFCIYFTNNLFNKVFIRQIPICFPALGISHKKLTMDFKIIAYKPRMSLSI
ncbi:unnamed protein product, partial [Vitis vinifera]|uniref:Uncharacterized protein n=1 Tax=Vitis vinifera TaxID=29760 RepID=D7TH61_VITVI